MKRVLFIAVVASLVMASCGQKTGKVAETAPETIPVTSISELVSNPLEYGDKVVRIEGVIDHMCRNSGDKMRVKESGSDLSIEVQLADLASEFSVELEGRTVAVEGILQYTVGNKQELGEEAGQHAEGEEPGCESEKAAAEALKAKGIDPSITTFINISKYELK
ncbi:MAG: hypothetical protein IH591_10700 [Bacteroidales bacterium]|nr:hypothetical protein [Bacteroidales bacterium]